MRSGKKGAALVAALFMSFSVHALDRAALGKLANGDNDEKIQAIGALVAEGQLFHRLRVLGKRCGREQAQNESQRCQRNSHG